MTNTFFIHNSANRRTRSTMTDWQAHTRSTVNTIASELWRTQHTHTTTSPSIRTKSNKKPKTNRENELVMHCIDCLLISCPNMHSSCSDETLLYRKNFPLSISLLAELATTDNRLILHRAAVSRTLNEFLQLNAASTQIRAFESTRKILCYQHGKNPAVATTYICRSNSNNFLESIKKNATRSVSAQDMVCRCTFVCDFTPANIQPSGAMLCVERMHIQHECCMICAIS